MTTKKRATGKNNRRSAEKPDPQQEKVGYGRPPKQHAIKPGEVRNRWGRRGKPRPEVDFLDGYVLVSVNGRLQKMTRSQALDEALFQKAMKGSVAATKMLEQRAERRRAAKTQGGNEEALSAEEDQILERFLEKETKRRLKKRCGNTK